MMTTKHYILCDDMSSESKQRASTRAISTIRYYFASKHTRAHDYSRIVLVIITIINKRERADILLFPSAQKNNQAREKFPFSLPKKVYATKEMKVLIIFRV